MSASVTLLTRNQDKDRGFVNGATQTHLSWESWVDAPDAGWFHDLVHANGTPYRASEAQSESARGRCAHRRTRARRAGR